MTAPADLLAEATAIAPELVTLRRDLHRIPEIGLHLPLTQARVLAALEGLGLEIGTGTALSSVVAVLRGGRPGPAVLLRGDMDALPVAEASAEPVTSEHAGVMHACGHDLHMAGLVGAARLLAAHRDELAGDVVLMFQPGEEGDHGARVMIEEGVLDAAGERVVAAYALHVTSALLPLGQVTGRTGTIMAGADQMLVTVHGKGGHGSAPHMAQDPVTVAAEIVLAFQLAVTRQFDAHDPVVVSVGRIAAGTKDNIIPATAQLDATVRTFSPATRAVVAERLTRVAEHVAAAHGLRAEVVYERGYPTTQTSPGEADRVERLMTQMSGEGSWVWAPSSSSGAEDFSYVLEQVPGAYVLLGATPRGQDPATAAYNHSPLATFDEGSLPVAAALLASLAMDRLAVG